MKEMPAAPAAAATPAATSDKERIRIGAGYRLPAAAPANVADQGKIRMGAGYRLPGLIAGIGHPGQRTAPVREPAPP